MINVIISGGQCGADQGGLAAGRALGISTGGYAPKNYRTEDGSMRKVLEDYGLMEHDSLDYPPRTADNVRLSDGTIIFGHRTPGSNLTEEECRKQGKPCLWVIEPTPNMKQKLLVRSWIRAQKITVLNVAGNRESKNKGIALRVFNFLMYCLKDLK